ncbi:MAG: biopolymer transporter ExbD [Pyrinomonadaceae bacterium]
MTSVDLGPAPLQAEPNVTPMIDLLLVMLIIYMLALVPRQAITATLPAPAPEALARPGGDTQIVLDLTADGGYALNSQPVPAAMLASTLRSVYAGRPAMLLFRPRLGRPVLPGRDLGDG